ncbi:GNAT family N-acetyltransferase [Microvirga rosea]|uniref:GNAT family N-acetyltransferase n=1 Tax=Microvirga rosea TaxID=2715425 RepID=UPI001D0A2AAA|nr:GNAT family N-acetyltransferase [Microvirga rosea]MCB8822534.1 GNAT family N-acetyltransferase [Microvirga rosea]
MSVIRSATPADLRAVEAAVRAAYGSYVVRIGKEPGPMQDDYATLIDQGRVYVIDDGGVVGVLVLIPEQEAMLLDNIAVKPEVQGKGYGRRLLAFAEDEARRHGLRRVRLYTNVLMVENLSLYSSLGYIETHRGEQNGYSRVFMEKSLH